MKLDFLKYKSYQFCDNSECEYFEKIGSENIGIKIVKTTKSTARAVETLGSSRKKRSFIT